MAGKTSDIKVRVQQATKDAIVAIAQERGESESVVVREAIRVYLEEHQEIDITAAKPVTYWKTKRKRKAA